MIGHWKKWKHLLLQYLNVFDETYGVKIFVLKVTKNKVDHEFNKIQTYYQEMKLHGKILFKIEKSFHSVTEPGEQHIWCNII